MENKQLIKAVISVMKDIKGIEKNLTVGAGNNSYKGVSDQDVKKITGDLMVKYGLCILPISIEPAVFSERWEAEYQGQKQIKQQVRTEVKTKYLLMHESGESMEVAGYGHGVDSQDKSAGKATTYALKYALLYMFMIPTGKIDDADTTHSDTIETPKAEKQKPWLNQKQFDSIKKRIQEGEDIWDKTLETFLVKNEYKQEIEKLLA